MPNLRSPCLTSETAASLGLLQQMEYTTIPGWVRRRVERRMPRPLGRSEGYEGVLDQQF